MITAERLEELIRQGATIWADTLWYTGKIYLINNDTDEYQILKDIDNNYVYLNHHKKGTDHCYDGDWCLEDLREDVDRAEWEYKMTAERTERFEPPMWEDIEDYYCFNFIIDNYHRCFVVEKGKKYRKYNLIKIDDAGFGNIFEKYASDVTEENYIKACEIVRDLFNRGNK